MAVRLLLFHPLFIPHQSEHPLYLNKSLLEAYLSILLFSLTFIKCEEFKMA